MSVKDILENLVKFNTIKDKENKEILNYIEGVLSSKNFKVEYNNSTKFYKQCEENGNSKVQNKCLIMSLNDKTNKLGFLGHTDTVMAGKGWETNPFILTEENNKLIGLGACDMKGGIAAIMQAILETDWDSLKYGMKVYFTYDEEIGFSGIKEIVESKENFPENMIIGEPTNNIIMNSSKGLLELKITFTGISAHSSLINQGENAIEKCLKFLEEFTSFYNELKNEKNNNFEIPYTTMNIGKIDGGNSINIVPDKCEVLIDFRIINNKHTEIILNKVDEIIKKYSGNYEILNKIPSFMPNNDKVCPTNFITEASFIKSKNRYILGVGPVNPHKVNEYVTKESLEKLVKQYKEMIVKYCEK